MFLFAAIFLEWFIPIQRRTLGVGCGLQCWFQNNPLRFRAYLYIAFCRRLSGVSCGLKKMLGGTGIGLYFLKWGGVGGGGGGVGGFQGRNVGFGCGFEKLCLALHIAG